MKWDNDSGHTDALLPLLKAIHTGNVKKVIASKFPEFFTDGEVNQEGREFYDKCVLLFPFLQRMWRLVDDI